MRKGKQLTLYTLLMIALIFSGFVVTHYREQIERSIEPLASVQGNADTQIELIPSGRVIGVRVVTEGVYVMGTSDVETTDGHEKPSQEKLKKGDIIFKLNDNTLESKEQLRELVEANGQAKMTLEIERKGERVDVEIQPAYSQNEAAYKLGIWVKDGTQGIGTLTYIHPDTYAFGALGHGITDGELKKLLVLKDGDLTKTTLTKIKKGEAGNPGQLGGTVDATVGNVYGDIEINTNLGIYGTLNERGQDVLQGEAVPIGTRQEVEEGPATILLDIAGTIQSYTISIQKVSRYTSEPAKGMVIKITDPNLLELTNGIVQGMSGSPIIQNGKIIGAVTHVFVNDPTKGYGIFIENMLQMEQ